MVALLLFLILAVIVIKTLFNMTVTVAGGILGAIILLIISARKRRK